MGKIRQIYIYYKIEQHDSTKTKGENQTNIYIYTKREDQTDIYIYAIRLNNMTPLKQRGKIRRTIYIYTIRLNNRPPLKQRGNIRRTYIYTKGED